SVLWFAQLDIFFFQAEDGIRDWSVTGVQTCALPISAAALRPPRRVGLRPARDGRRGDARLLRPLRRRRAELGVLLDDRLRPGPQIGRASCRERVESAVGAGSCRTRKRDSEAGMV